MQKTLQIWAWEHIQIGCPERLENKKTRPAGERPPPRLSIKKRPVDPGRENPRKPASGLGLAAPWPWAGP